MHYSLIPLICQVVVGKQNSLLIFQWYFVKLLVEIEMERMRKAHIVPTPLPPSFASSWHSSVTLLGSFTCPMFSLVLVHSVSLVNLQLTAHSVIALKVSVAFLCIWHSRASVTKFVHDVWVLCKVNLRGLWFVRFALNGVTYGKHREWCGRFGFPQWFWLCATSYPQTKRYCITCSKD